MPIDFTKIEDEALRESFKQEFDKLSKHEGYVSQSDYDRKVNEISQKSIKDEKEIEKRIRKEIEDDAKKTAEEKAQDILNKVATKERDIALRENKLNAIEKLTKANVPKEQIESLLSILVTDKIEETDSKLENFLKVFNSLENSIKETLANGTPPPNGAGGSAPQTKTKKDFDAMSYEEQIEFKQENPDLFKKFLSEI